MTKSCHSPTENPPMSCLVTLKITCKFCPRDGKALRELSPHLCSFHLFCFTAPTVFHAYKTCQTPACLRAFALAVPAVKTHPSPALHIALLFHL